MQRVFIRNHIVNKHSKLIVGVICVAIIFFCRYQVWFSFMPMTMLRLLQLSGTLYLILWLTQHHLCINRQLFIVIILNAVFAAYAAFVAKNAGQDLAIFRMITNLPFFIGIILFIFDTMRKSYQTLSPGRILDFWIYTALIQIVISLSCFFNHNIFNWLSTVQTLPDGILKREELINIRIMGLGNYFFGAGFNYTIDLLVLALMPYVKGSLIYSHKHLYLSIVTGVIITGIFSARTFFVGMAIVILFLLIVNRKHKIHFFANSFRNLLYIGCFLGILYTVVIQHLDNWEGIGNWAFELFINLFSGDGMESSSTDKMMNMYIFPENIHTWLGGDGKIENSDGSYYMHTDIGFIRLIFFWGLPMTVLYYIYRFYCVRVVYKNYPLQVIKPFMLCYLLFEYIANVKGLVFGDFFLSYMLVFVLLFSKRDNSLIRSASS